MDNYYSVSDFIQYSQFWNKSKKDINKFTEVLNDIIKKENINLDVCIVLNTIKKYLSDIQYNHLLYYTTQKYDNYIVYLFFKFILLEQKDKNIIFDYITNIPKFFINNIFEDFSNIYDIINNDIISNFIDITDIYNNFEILDISKINNINDNIVFYFKNLYKFENFVHQYNRLEFIYRFIYYMSNDISTNELNAKDDFVKRFEMTIDKFIIMNNFINVHYYDIICYKIIKNTYNDIPSDSSIINNDNKVLNYNDKLYSISNLLYNLYRSEHHTFYSKINTYLNYYCRYYENYANDEYKLLFLLTNNPYTIGEKMYIHIQSKFIQKKNIEYIYSLYCNYIEYMKSNDIDYDNCNLYLFLKNIIDIYNYKYIIN